MYDVTSTATELRVRPATLYYWHRMLGEASPATYDDNGELLFTHDALHTYRWLRHVILDGHGSLNDVLTQLRTEKAAPQRPAGAHSIDAGGGLLDESLRSMQADIQRLTAENRHILSMLAHVVRLLEERAGDHGDHTRTPRHFRIVPRQPAPPETDRCAPGVYVQGDPVWVPLKG